MACEILFPQPGIEPAPPAVEAQSLNHCTAREVPGYRVLLGCTPQAYKACACPASRPKKEPEVSNRDINGLMDGGAYTSEARSWSDTPLCAADGGQDMVAVFAPEVREGYQLEGNWCQVGSLVTRGTSITASLIRTITSWGLGQVCRKVSHLRRV